MATNHNTDTTVPSVEGLVRRIVGSLPSLQQVQPERTEHAQDPQDELNHRFNIPRGPVGESQSAPNGPPTSLVPLGRSTGSDRSENSRTPEGDVLARSFNPQQNYGYTNYNRRARMPARSPAAPYTQSRPGSSCVQRQFTNKPSQRVEPPTFKEVILLPKPTYDKVPKYKRKVELHKQGLILDSVPIERWWSESDLRDQIRTIFQHKIKNDTGYIGYVNSFFYCLISIQDKYYMR